MMHNLFWRSSAVLVVAGSLFFSSGESLAAAEAGPYPEETDVCIPKSIEQKVTACPEGAGANKFREVARAKVGTTTIKEVEKEKKGDRS